ncbi:MAG: 50S ribosomal protein L11 methyltransferase [Alistipes sp.]|nr:50S ribosomal protein L11 methyltransferase [Alistipes sp.]
MANYIELNAVIEDAELADIVVAELAEFPFESFANEPAMLKAYIPQAAMADCMEQVNALLDRYGVTHRRYVQIESQNWNALWESNFEEVLVADRVAIRAPFHAPHPEFGSLDIVIMPKMSFGTGHHSTTRLMVEMLLGMEVEGRQGLDMGSGTGVLAILAAKLGAATVDAVDIDDMADESCRENAVTNGVAEKVHPILGDVRSVASGKYDFIVANINRNILLRDMPAYVGMLNDGGVLVMSGFLEEDIAAIAERAESLGMAVGRQKRDGGWVALEFVK